MLDLVEVLVIDVDRVTVKLADSDIEAVGVQLSVLVTEVDRVAEVVELTLLVLDRVLETLLVGDVVPETEGVSDDVGDTDQDSDALSDGVTEAVFERSTNLRALK